jgi:superfamily II DNA or RNA helicase
MRSDARTLGTIANLEDSPLFNRSTAPLAINYRSSSRVVSEDELKRAMQKALRRDNVIFRLEEQREALYTIVSGNQTTLLVVVLPTGGGKSLLFMAPACLIDPGVTIVVVPYCILLDNLLKTAKDTGIDCIEYRPRE